MPDTTAKPAIAFSDGLAANLIESGMPRLEIARAMLATIYKMAHRLPVEQRERVAEFVYRTAEELAAPSDVGGNGDE